MCTQSLLLCFEVETTWAGNSVCSTGPIMLHTLVKSVQTNYLKEIPAHGQVIKWRVHSCTGGERQTVGSDPGPVGD